MTTTQERFKGFAFPVIRVRYAGPTDTLGSRYIAAVARGDEIDRATVPYDYELGGGAANALQAARKAWAKRQAALASITGIPDPDDDTRVFVPGNPDTLDRAAYLFTVVPAYFFEEQS